MPQIKNHKTNIHSSVGKAGKGPAWVGGPNSAMSLSPGLQKKLDAKGVLPGNGHNVWEAVVTRIEVAKRTQETNTTQGNSIQVNQSTSTVSNQAVPVSAPVPVSSSLPVFVPETLPVETATSVKQSIPQPAAEKTLDLGFGISMASLQSLISKLPPDKAQIFTNLQQQKAKIVQGLQSGTITDKNQAEIMFNQAKQLQTQILGLASF